MNNKGQSLVLFIMLLPIVIMAFALIFDSAIIIMENNKLKSVAKEGITYLIKDDKSEKVVEDIIKKNEKELIKLEISKDNGTIHIVKHITSYFGKIIGYDYYELEVNLYGYISNGKLIIEEKG